MTIEKSKLSGNSGPPPTLLLYVPCDRNQSKQCEFILEISGLGSICSTYWWAKDIGNKCHFHQIFLKDGKIVISSYKLNHLHPD